MRVLQRQIDLERMFACTTFVDRARFLIGLAVTAPSTHNSQPWEFTITDHSCQLWSHSEKRLPEADPSSRDFYISLGCVLENFVIAAQYYGLYKEVCLYTEGDLIAEISLSDTRPLKQRDYEELCDSMLKRYNARGTFAPIPIPEILFEKFDEISRSYRSAGIRFHLLQHSSEIETIANLTAKGIAIARSRSQFRKEFSRWFRPNSSRRQDGIPGYAVGLSLLPSFIALLLMRYCSLAKILVKKNITSILTAPAVCVIESDGDSPQTWLHVGRLAERLMLECYRHGVSTSIFVAAIEMGSISSELAESLHLTGAPQFLFTCGFSLTEQQQFTPRRLVDDVLR